jgi:hypothetical protein
MKWKDLSLKERKQIYDSVRANNPDATYFDIKEQFDSIPAYEGGKDNSVAAVYSLPEVNVYPQNRFGDIARSQGYETAKNWQAVKNATTAGINEFANDPRTQFVLAALPMLTLKRSLKDSGKITNWSTPVDEKMILEYMRNPTSNKMVKNQYDLYRNKNEYIDRLNKLIPMEILMPLGGAGFIGNELNKE